MTDWMEINGLLKQIDFVLSESFINIGENNIIKLLQCYDLACNDCNLELEKKIKDFLLLNEELLIPIIKNYFSKRAFEMELDYLYFLLEHFSSETICDLKDDWLNSIFELNLMGDASYAYLYNDAYEILIRNNAYSKSELKQLFERNNFMIEE